MCDAMQPPGIRHRVLEASPGMEVVELSCPAEHATFVEHEMALPTGLLAPDRDFGGQRFVHHVGAAAAWVGGPAAGLERRDSAVAEATDGRAALRGLRPGRADEAPVAVGGRDDGTGRYRAWFVAAGSVTVAAGGRPPVELARRGALVAPLSTSLALTAWSSEAEVLEIVFAPD